MKIEIIIGEGVLGPKTGVTSQYRQLDTITVLIDPTRVADRRELRFVVMHELEHALCAADMHSPDLVLAPSHRKLLGE